MGYSIIDECTQCGECRLKSTIANIKARRKIPPTEEHLEGRTLEQYYEDEAYFIMAFEDGCNLTSIWED
jgi:hypothetical protein